MSGVESILELEDAAPSLGGVPPLRGVDRSPVIEFVGVGDGGNAARRAMATGGIDGVELAWVDVDEPWRFGPRKYAPRGSTRTRPEIGAWAATEGADRIRDLIEGVDVLLLTARMGWGTGTGMIPVVARIARETGLRAGAIVAEPFEFEGRRCRRAARAGIEALAPWVHPLTVVPSAKVLRTLGRGIPLADAFEALDAALLDAVRAAVEGRRP